MTAAIPVVLNSRAGTGAATPDRLRALFRDAGLAADIIGVDHGDEIESRVREAMISHPPLVVAGGGDGTISAVAAVLAGTESVLGVLPLGTLNHFARDLGIPPAVEAAVRVLATGRVARVDLGEVNDRTFLNNSSLGLYPRMVHHRDQQRQRLGRNKWAAVFRAALTLLYRYPQLVVRVEVEGREFLRRTPLVFIGNNKYEMTGLNIGTRDRLDAGMLSLYIPHHPGRLALFRLAFRALFGELRQATDFDLMTATEIRLETGRHAVRVATDGEVAGMTTPLRYRIRPGALRVMIPRAGADEVRDSYTDTANEP